MENDCSCDGGLGDKDPTLPSDEEEMLEVKRLQQSFEAVSYTHLTLPTKA